MLDVYIYAYNTAHVISVFVCLMRMRQPEHNNSTMYIMLLSVVLTHPDILCDAAPTYSLGRIDACW